MTTYLQVRGTGPFEVIESDAPAPDGWQRMTRDEYAALAATYVPPPQPLPPLRFADWLSFYRHAERKVPGLYRRVVAASQQSADIAAWLTLASGQGEMHMNHPETIAGFAALVQAGVITQAERDALFEP
jgi:hypothetical protein